jgi:signal transduction histidine kinase
VNASLDIKESPLACGFGVAYVGAMIGGLIQQGRPLPALLNTLCRLFDAAAEGYCSSILLFDRTRTRIRHAVGPGLPSGYCGHVEGLHLRGAEAACARGRDQPEVVISQVTSERLREGKSEPDLARACGLRSCKSWPILSSSGDLLGILAIYQRETVCHPFHPALVQQLTDIASIAIDRTRNEEALRRSEALLAKAQRLSSTGSFSWRPATNEMTWSEELFRIFEFDPAETITLEQMLSCVHPEDISLFYALVERARRDGGDLDCEHRLLTRATSVKYVHLVAHGTRDQDGQLEYIGAIQDVTQRRLSEQALDKLRSELAHVSRVTSLGALTASIAHEVNQPLLGVITNASTCLRVLTTDSPDLGIACEAARLAIRDGQRASEVIARLRALFSKRSATSEPVDLNEATREVIALLSGELQRRGAIVRPDLSRDLPTVVGDRVQLQQVILNLLMNAAEAMTGVDDRPRSLAIRTELDADGCVQLNVQDAGVGIKPQDAARLFDAFYTTKAAGMGIGLSVSNSIIEGHGGRLWAQANAGPGATFSFSIPRVPHDAPEPCHSRPDRALVQAECFLANSR